MATLLTNAPIEDVRSSFLHHPISHLIVTSLIRIVQQARISMAGYIARPLRALKALEEVLSIPGRSYPVSHALYTTRFERVDIHIICQPDYLQKKKQKSLIAC